MANWPQFAGWPGVPPAQQQQPSPPTPYGKNAADFRPVSPFLQHSPRLSPPGFHQFPPRGSGPPPGPRGQAVYGNVYPSGSSPGFSDQGWSPSPRGYPATVPGFRPSSPNVIHPRSQILLPGIFVSVIPPSQSNGPDQQPGLGPHDSRKASVIHHNGVPWSNDLRRNSAEPLFLNWIDESAKSFSFLGDSSDCALSLKSSPKSSDLYKLVDIVEDTIGKVLALTDLQNSRTEWGVCPFNSRHVVPVEALFRHTLQCGEGTADVSSLLHTLQYPHTVDLDSTELVAHDGRINDCLGSSSNYATLSFEDVALLKVNHTPIRKFENLNQESGDVETENLSEIPRVEMKVGTTDNLSEMPECRTLTLSKSRQQFDPRGSLFFYEEAPGVVLTSLGHCSSKGFGDPMLSMPASLRLEIEKCSYVTLERKEIKDRRDVSSITKIENVGAKHDGVVKESSSVRLLPSILWSFGKELNSWKDTPSLCSRTVLEAATSLGGVRKVLIVEWLLVQSPVYGVVLDVAMASHISCLVQLYLKALRTQSLMLLDQTDSNKRDVSIKSGSMVIECPIYAEASTWLASLLSHLYGSNNSKAVVLGILKHCLKACGRFLLTVPSDLHSQHGKDESKTGDVEVALDNEFEVFMEHGKMLSKGADNASVHVSNLEEVLEVKQVGAAMDALYERVNFERFIRSGLNINNITKNQRLANYDMAVNFANIERAKRPNYRAVCEHDGLTWQRSQQQEKKNKTKAELLAEERDYKRRRMSYRGKKLKRTPLQILHDIIENHMTEITEAGGIGYFSKEPMDIPSISHMDFGSEQQLQGSIPKNPIFQHHSESAHHSRMTNTDSASSELQLYDEHRETLSVFRPDSRFRSQSRHDDQRYHNSRR